MARRKSSPEKNGQSGDNGITSITVAGFKSIAEEQTIEVRPLTILAGANSSGKSSMMQPLLLLKQTLEASYDPGTLLLNGPNVRFTSADQVLSRIGKRQVSDFQIGLRLSTEEQFQTTFRKEHKMGFRIEQMEIDCKRGPFTFWPEMTQTEIIATGLTKDFPEAGSEGHAPGEWQIRRDRCFIGPVCVSKGLDGTTIFAGGRPGPVWENIIPQIIHLPGLRGKPERNYPVSDVGPPYPGSFENYSASVILSWTEGSKEAIEALNSDLRRLKLTGGVSATRPNGVQIELQVGRLPDVSPTRLEDRVNIADVGVGISQTLPILVALRAAKAGQLVYIEQPELHLHPRAQTAMAEVIADAARRGVRVVIETHSSLLILGIQSLVAEGKLAPDLVKLHWFKRRKDGSTEISTGDLDEAGAYGDWPEDFDDVALQAESRYLDAAEARHRGS